MQFKNSSIRFVRHYILLASSLLLCLSFQASAQQAPPTLGQETKGQPAVDETLVNAPENSETDRREGTKSEQTEASQSGIDSLLGKAEIKESRRENGQRYLIELEHSSGAKQYIEETDSDGKLESTSNDIEETPNLPKWKLGSW